MSSRAGDGDLPLPGLPLPGLPLPDPDILTDPEALRAGDRYDLLPALATAGAQVRATAEQLRPISFERPRSMLVIEPVPSGDGALAAALLTDPASPVVVGSTLPRWAGPLDLAVVLAGSVEDGSTAELVADATRRGVMLVVRGAAHGPVAAAAGPALLAPRIAAPEIAAGAARVALLLAVAIASAVGSAGSGSAGTREAPSAAALLDAVADALDAEALACGPAAEAFVNPALGLALALQAGPALLVAEDPAGLALARRGARSLRLLGGVPAAAEHAAGLLPGGQLLARLARRADPFADPERDVPGVATPVPLIVDPPDGASRHLSAAVARALPRAVTLAADDPADPPAARALAVALRLDFAAAYLGIAAGQVAPPDGPQGLGPSSGVRGARPAATVEDVTTDDWDDWDDRGGSRWS